eukprot:tig00001085_g6944.t1
MEDAQPMEVDAQPSAGPSKSNEEPVSVDGASSLPFVEKYRPSALSDLISHQDIISTLQKLIKENRLPHLLFYGPPGTGKTSTILAMARQIYGPRYQSMILELNASDDRGIDVVREQIKSFASTRNIFSSGFKLIVLDEADAMTGVAQGALRRVIEKYTRNVRFCLICNYVNKIIPALQSRCMRFRFQPLSDEQIQIRLEHIVKQEKIEVTEDGREALIKLGCGDMRRILNNLQSTYMASGIVNSENVYLCTGNPLPKDIESMGYLLLNTPFQEAQDGVQELKSLKGLALADIVRDIFDLINKLQLPPGDIIDLLPRLATVEANLAVGASERLQLGALVGAFQYLRESAMKEAGKSGTA